MQHRGHQGPADYSPARARFQGAGALSPSESSNPYHRPSLPSNQSSQFPEQLSASSSETRPYYDAYQALPLRTDSNQPTYSEKAQYQPHENQRAAAGAFVPTQGLHITRESCCKNCLIVPSWRKTEVDVVPKSDRRILLQE